MEPLVSCCRLTRFNKFFVMRHRRCTTTFQQSIHGLISKAEAICQTAIRSGKKVILPHARLRQGALLGLFATSLYLTGYWQVYQGLGNANGFLTLITIILCASASIIGAFVHGAFYYMGEYIHALNDIHEKLQSVVAAMIQRHRNVLITTYAPVLTFIFPASILFSMLVASGKTLFPVWMAVINPATLTILWLLLKRIVPPFLRDHTEGAGFKIAFLAFFACTTATLWNL
jgi:hypothetical protein